jgi:hypothetical protein
VTEPKILHRGYFPGEKKEGAIKRTISLPQDHGSWVFLLSPLLIGLFTAGNWSLSTVYLILAALAAFLIRQPVTIATKAYTGRRSRKDLREAWFWILVYGLLGLLAFIALLIQGYGYLVYLALPAIPVFIWHLTLVSRRAERKQIGVEIVGSGTLALAAPAAYWVGVGNPDPIGWWLFLLAWFQSAASIVYAYARLEQRELKVIPNRAQRITIGRRAILYTSFNFLAVGILSAVNFLPLLLPVPYLLQLGETVYGTLVRPAVGYKPTRIGLRQLIVSSLFTILFIVAWNISP